MEGVWFVTNYYESLGDVYIKYGFLDWRQDQVTDIIDNEAITFLMSIVGKQNLQYFEYDLKHDKTGNKTTIIPSNIICALWFIGIFPENISEVYENNRFETTEFIYTFDEKNYKLKKRKRKLKKNP